MNMKKTILALMLCASFPALARDDGQWTTENQRLRQWYQNLMQPDSSTASCCGEADAYWCDELETEYDAEKKAHNYCRITDERPDEPRHRRHIDIGTRFEIPNEKMKWNPNDPQSREGVDLNPTGHSIIFLSRGDYVYCFVPGGGV
jgi:hypothetical protein